MHPALQDKTVVICEDEGVTQMQLTKTLRHAGLIVAGSAINGQQALNVIREKKPDLVLLDIRMPIMDGLQVLQELSDLTDTVCFVMLSAYADESKIAQAKRLGAKGYIQKPITSESLLPQIEKMFTLCSQRAVFETFPICAF